MAWIRITRANKRVEYGPALSLKSAFILNGAQRSEGSAVASRPFGRLPTLQNFANSAASPAVEEIRCQMLAATMNLDDIVNAAPNVLETITRELFNKADAAMLADGESQLTACLELGLRCASIMYGMARVLDPHTLDAFETLNRAAIEARDLLMHFRFDHQDTRKKIGYWFAGAKDNAWKADHARLDHFLTKQVAVLANVNLGLTWSKMSVLAHPTKYASDNSSVLVVNRLTGRLRPVDIENFTLKRADYVVGIARLFMATYDLPGWIPLGLKLANIPDCHSFVINAEMVAGPIVAAPVSHPLPDHSVRPPRKKL